MKVATLRIPNDPTSMPDGGLVRVSDDLSVLGLEKRKTLQEALDKGFAGLASNHSVDAKDFEFAAPLPRAFQFLDGSAYVNHVALVRQARGAEMPERFWTDPLMYQGCSTFLAPTDPITGDPDWGIDFEAEVAVITADVPRGVAADDAPNFIKYVMLLNDISLRNLIPDELSKGFGFVQSKPPSA